MDRIEAGWYPDPAGAGDRYWDGDKWTTHTHGHTHGHTHDHTAARTKDSPRTAPHLIWGGAVFIALGSPANWAYDITSLSSGVRWPVTGDLFPHGYLFLVLSAIGLGLFFRGTAKDNVDTVWTCAVITLIIVGIDAVYVLVRLRYDLQSLGAGLFLTLGGAVALFIGASIMRNEARQAHRPDASADKLTAN